MLGGEKFPFLLLRVTRSNGNFAYFSNHGSDPRFTPEVNHASKLDRGTCKETAAHGMQIVNSHPKLFAERAEQIKSVELVGFTEVVVEKITEFSLIDYQIRLAENNLASLKLERDRIAMKAKEKENARSSNSSTPASGHGLHPPAPAGPPEVQDEER